MLSAIQDDNPVLFFTDLALAFTPGEVTGGLIPLGRAAVRRSGADVALIAYAKTVHTSKGANRTFSFPCSSPSLHATANSGRMVLARDNLGRVS